MSVTINGTTGITTPDVDSTADISVNGLTVGKGAGNVATNTAVGVNALAANTTGGRNTAVGRNALLTSTTPSDNSAFGDSALGANTTGAQNSAFGRTSLLGNTTGSSNAGFGYESLYTNSSGNYNTALGNSALYSNTTASNNTAVGYQAGYSNSTSDGGTYVGYQAGYSSTNTNTAFGRSALYSTTGILNTALGWYAGNAITTGTKNTIIGSYSGNQGGLDIRTSSNYIVLSDGDGNPKAWWDAGYNCKLHMGSGGGTNTMKYNTTTYEVTYDTSSARYKDNIRDSVYGLNTVLALSAKQFEYKKDGRSDVGLIAEEVVSIIPELVGTDADGRPDSVTYDRMVSVLVKAIQELSAQVTALQAEVNTLKGA